MNGLPSRRRPGAAGAFVAGALLVLAAGPAGALAPVLDGVVRARVTVDVAPPVDGLAAGALRARVAGALLRAAPPVVADDEAADRLRLRVAIEPRTATDLRGFWLPLSGTYAIGIVSLALERAVVVATSPERSATAIVWREDRVIAVPWRRRVAEVHRAADAMIEALLAARGAS